MEIIKREKLDLSTPEKVVQALVAIKETKEFLATAEKLVRGKAEEFLENREEIMLEDGENKWQVKKTRDIETTEYSAKKIFDIFGEGCLEIMKVSSTEVEKLKKELLKNEDAETFMKVAQAGKTKIRKGNIVMRELK